LRKITNNELELLKICWEKKECTAREVFEESLRTKDRKYETIKTTMERMVQFGYLDRRKIGPVWLYKPKEPQEKFVRRLTRQFLQTVFNGNIVPFFCSLLKVGKYTKKELQFMKEKIEKLEDD